MWTTFYDPFFCVLCLHFSGVNNPTIIIRRENINAHHYVHIMDDIFHPMLIWCISRAALNPPSAVTLQSYSAAALRALSWMNESGFRTAILQGQSHPRSSARILQPLSLPSAQSMEVRVPSISLWHDDTLQSGFCWGMPLREAHGMGRARCHSRVWLPAGQSEANKVLKRMAVYRTSSKGWQLLATRPWTSGDSCKN